jgi:hypothetical protein
MSDLPTGLERLTAGRLRELSDTTSRHRVGKTICSAIYMFPEFVVPYTKALSKAFFTWAVDTYHFEVLPDAASKLTEVERLSEGMKSLTMPDELDFRRGRHYQGDRVNAFLHLLLRRSSDSRERYGVMLDAETEVCEQVVMQVITKLGEIAGYPKSWDHYAPFVEERHYTTQSTVQAPKNIAELLDPKLRTFLAEQMAEFGREYVLRGAAPVPAEDLEVTVHPYNLEMKVHVYDKVNASKITMDLEVSHEANRDVTQRIMLIRSDLPSDVHATLVNQLLQAVK